MAAHEHDAFRRIQSPFQGQRVRLRAVEDEDLGRINESFWDPEVSRHLSVMWPEALAGTRSWRERRRHDKDQVSAIESESGELIGVCSLEDVHADTRSATLGIWLARSHWDKGYGTDAARTLCRFGFREMNLQRIGLGVYETNARAIKAYRKVGFTEEGRHRRDHFVDGRYVDLVLMGLMAEELTEA